MNHLHQGFDMLPPYTAPETYIESYLPQDFSLGGNQVTDMRIIGYEDNQDLANAFASYTGFLALGKSMRCSFDVNGIHSKGSFTIVTKELTGYGTTVDFLAGIFAPADQFDMDAPMLIDVFNSIKVMPQYRDICTPPIGGCYKCIDVECCGHPCDAYGRCD